MRRLIQLVVYCNGPKQRAHWAIFVPEIGEERLGKRIHVVGNPATGFFLQFDRGCNLEDDDRLFQLIDMAEVGDNIVSDVPGDSSTDTIARDQLESFATTVPPPGPSQTPFDPQAPNCQTWITSYVEGLKERDIVPESAVTVVQNAKRYF